MSLGRALVERFQEDVLEWLASRAQIVVVDPWVEPERWEREVTEVDAIISRKGKITREHLHKSRDRLKVVARTGVGVDPSSIDLDAAREYKVWVTNMPGSNAIAVAELALGQMIALARHTPRCQPGRQSRTLGRLPSIFRHGAGAQDGRRHRHGDHRSQSFNPRPGV